MARKWETKSDKTVACNMRKQINPDTNFPFTNEEIKVVFFNKGKAFYDPKFEPKKEEPISPFIDHIEITEELYEDYLLNIIKNNKPQIRIAQEMRNYLDTKKMIKEVDTEEEDGYEEDLLEEISLKD